MGALEDRNRLLAHLRECVSCPVSPCDPGLELAAAVRDSAAYGESARDWGSPGWYGRALESVRDGSDHGTVPAPAG